MLSVELDDVPLALAGDGWPSYYIIYYNCMGWNTSLGHVLFFFLNEA